MARSIALGVRGASGDGDLLAAVTHHPQRVVTAFDVHVVDVGAKASEMRNPFNASRDAKAGSRFDDSPAATRKAPSSLRSEPSVRDS